MKNSALEIEAVENPQNLSDSVIQEIQIVSQDIWSRMNSLGELCQCPDCKKIYAAEDIFPAELLAEKMVGELIQEEFGDSAIPCPDKECGGMTKFLFGSQHVTDIRARYTKSVNAFLVLCREKETGKIVGLEDGYIGNIREAAFREFQHYNPLGIDHNGSLGDDWLDRLEREARAVLGYSPERILTLSSIGIIEKYQSPFVLFGILKRFAEILPENYAIPGITEVDKRNTMYKLSLGIGGKCVSLNGNPARMQQMYDSNLIVYPDPITMYKERFTQGPKGFVKLIREYC
ncbi:MAG: hypothetical protein PHY14_02860 [Candidatus Gracilibacteria bacterium]|nr:hypothetical protein [Candidatus Gracilibacteria bacterium]